MCNQMLYKQEKIKKRLEKAGIIMSAEKRKQKKCT